MFQQFINKFLKNSSRNSNGLNADNTVNIPIQLYIERSNDDIDYFANLTQFVYLIISESSGLIDIITNINMLDIVVSDYDNQYEIVGIVHSLVQNNLNITLKLEPLKIVTEE